MRSLMRYRGDEHRIPPLCPHGHGFIPLTPGGKSAVCRARTGYDARGRTAWCGVTLMPTDYGTRGKPLPG